MAPWDQIKWSYIIIKGGLKIEGCKIERPLYLQLCLHLCDIHDIVHQLYSTTLAKVLPLASEPGQHISTPLAIFD